MADFFFNGQQTMGQDYCVISTKEGGQLLSVILTRLIIERIFSEIPSNE